MPWLHVLSRDTWALLSVVVVLRLLLQSTKWRYFYFPSCFLSHKTLAANAPLIVLDCLDSGTHLKATIARRTKKFRSSVGTVMLWQPAVVSKKIPNVSLFVVVVVQMLKKISSEEAVEDRSTSELDALKHRDWVRQSEREQCDTVGRQCNSVFDQKRQRCCADTSHVCCFCRRLHPRHVCGCSWWRSWGREWSWRRCRSSPSTRCPPSSASRPLRCWCKTYELASSNYAKSWWETRLGLKCRRLCRERRWNCQFGKRWKWGTAYWRVGPKAFELSAVACVKLLECVNCWK